MKAFIWCLICSLPLYADTAAQPPFVLRPTATHKVISLQDALLQAQHANKSIQIAKDVLEQKKTGVLSAWSGYLPKLSVGASYTRNFPEISANFTTVAQNQQQAQLLNSVARLTTLTQGLDPASAAAAAATAASLNNTAQQLLTAPIESVVIQPASVFGGSLTLTQPLLQLQALANVKQASQQVNVEKANVDKAKGDAMVGVARAYLQAAKTAGLLQIAINQVASYRQQVKAIKKRRRKGLVTVTDVARIQLELVNAENQVVQAKADHELAVGQLGYLIDEDSQFSIEPVSIPALENQTPSEALIQQAFGERPDMKVQRQSLALSKENHRGAYAVFFPTLNAVGQGVYTSNTSGFVDKPFTGTIMLQFNYNIFDGGDSYAKLKEQRYEVQQQNDKLADLTFQVEAEIRGRVRDIETKRNAVAAAKKVLELQRAIDRDTKDRFRRGLIDMTDLIDGSHQIVEKEINVANSVTDLDLARVELANASGNLLDVLGSGKDT